MHFHCIWKWNRRYYPDVLNVRKVNLLLKLDDVSKFRQPSTLNKDILRQVIREVDNMNGLKTVFSYILNKKRHLFSRPNM